MMMSTPSAGQRVDVFLNRFDLIHEDDGFAGRGDFLRVRGQRRDDADLNAVHVEDQRVADAARKRGFPLTSRLPETTGNRHRVQERDDAFGAVVELVVAQRHGVEADGLHELPGCGAVIGREEQAALVLVARIEDETFSPAAVSSSRNVLIAVAIRATPPKHSPAASSSASQVELKRLIGWMRLCRSLICRMWRVVSAATGAAIERPARIAVDPRIRENILLSLFIGWASA
jgi:hypothetical protein